MRNPLLVVLTLVLAACSTPSSEAPPAVEAEPAPAAEAPPAEAPPGEPIAEPGFDTRAWARAVEAASDDAALVARSAELLDAVDWRTACGEDDPTAPRRGIVQIHHLGADAVAEVTCQTFAYQSVFAVVDLRGPAPRLVRARLVGEDGLPADDVTESFLGLLSPADAPGTFVVFTKSAGHGGCGTEATYRLRPDGSAAVAEVRANADCSTPTAPEVWPITFEAE